MERTKEELINETKKLTNELVESFAKFLVENGVDEENSQVVARQVVLGSAIMLKNNNEHPCELIDRVCSPGGTTIEGLLTLQKNGFEKYIIERIEQDS